MKTHDDDISGLFKAIGSKNSPFVEFGDQANAANAQQRWPLFKTIGLEKRPPPPQLLQDEKDQWEKPAVPVAAITQPTPPTSKSASLSNKIAGNLSKLNHARTAAAPLRRETPPEAPSPSLNTKARETLLPAKPPVNTTGNPSWLSKQSKTDAPAPNTSSTLFGRLAKAAATEAAPKPMRSSRLFAHSADDSSTKSRSNPVASPPPAPRTAPRTEPKKSLFGSPAATPQHEFKHEFKHENKQENKHLSSLFARIQAPEQEPEPAPAVVKKRSFFNRLGKP
jgi:hypothetical protein